MYRYAQCRWYTEDLAGRGIGKESFKGEMCVDEKEIFEICQSVDNFIAAELTESIVRGTSYDMLEAHYGILPISRRGFFRRRGTARRLMRRMEMMRGKFLYKKIVVYRQLKIVVTFCQIVSYNYKIKQRSG